MVMESGGAIAGCWLKSREVWGGLGTLSGVGTVELVRVESLSLSDCLQEMRFLLKGTA